MLVLYTGGKEIEIEIFIGRKLTRLFFFFLRNNIVILFMAPLRQGIHQIKVGEHPPSTLYIR